jgi:ATP-dependent helicase/nuclease subunit B
MEDGMERVFLGWERPGLAAAVDVLVRRFGGPGTLDLGGVVIAVPGGRAGRRLLELILQRAEQDGRLLTPPKIITVGRLPEQLYRAKRPFADDLVQHLAWVAALQQMEPARLGNVVPSPPAKDDFAAWLSLAEMLGRLHRELAAEAQDFADVANCGSRLPGFREAPRWQTLAEVQQRYLRTLDGVGLWDLQTARLFAIRNGECTTQSEIMLVGAVDLNRAHQLMLDQVASHVTALVFAPEELADRFDEYGCIRPAAWQDVTVELRPEQIELAEAPADEAAGVVRTLAGFGGRYSGEEITIGVPDERLVSHLQHHLGEAGVAVRHGAGASVRRSGPCRLLQAVADYLDGRRFPAFAALVRHPAIEARLTEAGRELRGDWLTELDDYHARHLPHRVAGRPESQGKTPAHQTSEVSKTSEVFRNYPRLRRLHEAVEGLLSGLGGEKRAIAGWGIPLAELLAEVYGKRPLNPGVEPDRTILDACEAVHDALRGHQTIPGALMPALTAVEVLRLVLRQLDSKSIPPPSMPGAIELLGWLELPLDDAAALVVTGLNDGIVPASVNADLFLPNQLRLALGIEDNDRRYARDAYALSVLAASRKELRLIAGRRSADGEPLLPSRLLFACDKDTLVRRVKVFFSAAVGPRGATVPPLPLGEGGLSVPLPEPLPEPVTSMRVTEFRDYLACPYRYYLRHRLRLGVRSDDAGELDGMSFGSLAHEVLKELGTSAAAASTSPEEILAQLSASLDDLVRRQFGADPLAAVLVQVEQLRARLAAFARWQARWAAAGWGIKHVEISEEKAKASLVVDDRAMGIRGRIDRIDFHPGTGQWIVFDYKTSDAARKPEQAHRKGGDWVDLQLPLYRRLADSMGVRGDVQLGFILLPKDTGEVGECLAQWTQEDLLSADRAAEEVVRSVWAERFWPPTSPPPPGFEDLAAICQEGQFAAPLSGRSEEGNGQ